MKNHRGASLLILMSVFFHFYELKVYANESDDIASSDLPSVAVNLPLEFSEIDANKLQNLEHIENLSRSSTFDLGSSIPETIYNLGKTIWPVIVAGEPVVNMNTDWANALPVGVSHWETLEGWRTPISKTFHFKWDNMGIRMIDFQYDIVFTPGGTIKGKGQYIANLGIFPSDLHVFWGYSFSAQAHISSITNIGTLDNPIAAVQLILTWSIDTPLKKHRFSSNFYMTGAGDFTQLSPETFLLR